tara:strand:- start:616 stop:1068 length:453 start_codon:yes stop_codon:yes gene_type:complete
MRIIETKLYTIDDHPDKAKCFDWMRDNMHDLNQIDVDEVVACIKAFTETFGGEYDYSIGQVPSRGEFISITGYDEQELAQVNPHDYNLTGSAYDYDVIKYMQLNNPREILNQLHKATEDVYSDEGLEEFARGNDYEFTWNGHLFATLNNY